MPISVRWYCLVLASIVSIGSSQAVSVREAAFVRALSGFPIVQSCLFKRSVPIDHGKFEEHYVHARRQAGAFYHRELEKLADLDFLDHAPHGQFVSWFGTNYWGADGRKLFMYSGPALEEIYLVRTVRMKQLPVNRLFMMGIAELVPESVTWNDRAFRGKIGGLEPSPVTGRLELDSDGDPQILNYKFERGAREQRRRVRYFYSPAVRFNDFPYKIMAYAVEGEVEKLLEVFEVFELTLAKELMPDAFFDPDAVTVRGVAPTYRRGFLSTNGVSFEIQAPSIEITCPR